MKSFIFLLFIFCLSFASATEIKISPSQINFIGETNQRICEFISISADNKFLIGEDRWAEKDFLKRELSKHNLDSSSLDIELIYPKKISIAQNSEIEICLKGKESGNYHGVLLYRTKENPAGVGIWINVNLNKSDSGFISLTGNLVKKSEGTFNVGFVFVLTIILLVFGLVIIFILKKLKK